MTTGRINQVAARACRLCSWAWLTRAAHSFTQNRFSLAGVPKLLDRPGQAGQQRVHSPRSTDLRCALSTYRLACAHHGILSPGAHAPNGYGRLWGAPLFPFHASDKSSSSSLPRLDARTCPAQLELAHGVCLRARARTCACVCQTWGVGREVQVCSFYHLDSTTPLYMFRRIELPTVCNIKKNIRS